MIIKRYAVSIIFFILTISILSKLFGKTKKKFFSFADISIHSSERLSNKSTINFSRKQITI